METIGKSRTKLILKIMLVLTWIAFVGLMIVAGAILYTYSLSYFNPMAAKNLYNGLNLYNLSQFSWLHYSLFVAFMVGIIITKVFVTLLVLRILSKVNLENPFTWEVARTIEKISFVLLGTWLIALMEFIHTTWMLERSGTLTTDHPGVYFFIAGLIFIIAQVFKRGVELQSENDLTV